MNIKELKEQIELLKEENQQLKEDIENRAKECAKLRKQGAGTREQLEYAKVENQQLKDLLKECARELYDKPVRELGGYQQKMEYLKNLIKRIEEKLNDKAD